jgi:hypothetical protein
MMASNTLQATGMAIAAESPTTTNGTAAVTTTGTSIATTTAGSDWHFDEDLTGQILDPILKRCLPE